MIKQRSAGFLKIITENIHRLSKCGLLPEKKEYGLRVDRVSIFFGNEKDMKICLERAAERTPAFFGAVIYF